MLILDGHSSHLNMRFIDFCDAHAILLGFLPPHSTHRLQPLDVTVFSPLATAYSGQIDTDIQSSFGFTRITKRSFWSLFRNSWIQALTKSNIDAGFTATGIWPLDGAKNLQKLPSKTLSPSPSDDESKNKTPESVRGVRRAVKALKAKDLGISAGLDLIIRATEKLVIEKELLEHENKRLREALVGEKKRRKRGKAMDLFSKDEAGQAMFFSPSKVAAARTRQKESEAQKEQDKLDKEAEKERRAIEKEEKARRTQERKATRQRIAAEKREAKERSKEASALQKQANQQLRFEESMLATRATVTTSPKKQKVAVKPPIETLTSISRSGRNGRNITLPNRFRD